MFIHIYSKTYQNVLQVYQNGVMNAFLITWKSKKRENRTLDVKNGIKAHCFVTVRKSEKTWEISDIS